LNKRYNPLSNIAHVVILALVSHKANMLRSKGSGFFMVSVVYKETV